MLIYDHTIENSARSMPTPQSPARPMPIPGRFGGWLGIIQTWIERSRTRNALANLDDHFLNDVGITRAQATEEIAKPFWR